MTREDKIHAFHQLGKQLEQLSDDEFQSLATDTRNQNPWFTEDNIRRSFDGITRWLDKKSLDDWISTYDFNISPRKIAVVMAGNIPLVGFHDFLSVLISGHSLLIKSSSKDKVLLTFIVEMLTSIEPRFKSKIEYADQLKGFDAIIATGSDNTSRYFEYYFKKYPHIIRKNRTSVAIVDGHETLEDLTALGDDIFSYFGLGCRNVAKIFLPAGFRIDTLFECWSKFKEIINHHKYCNNYDYQKSVLLITQAPFLDNGFVMLQENKKLFSPLAVVYYEFYTDQKALAQTLEPVRSKIQCVVSNEEGSVKFGGAQSPMLGDYADQIDTLKFLTTLP
ncbi:MAG: acyl-CoA reductase [Chryseolinea sp.]